MDIVRSDRISSFYIVSNQTLVKLSYFQHFQYLQYLQYLQFFQNFEFLCRIQNSFGIFHTECIEQLGSRPQWNKDESHTAHQLPYSQWFRHFFEVGWGGVRWKGWGNGAIEIEIEIENHWDGGSNPALIQLFVCSF